MGKVEKLRWLMFSNLNDKFPYKLYIEEYPHHFLCLNVQERWPGPNKQIYCLREGHFNEDELPKSEPIEICFIKLKKQYGKKLEIVLDRKIKKRCWFLFLKKEYKKKKGEFYEQIFWITQSSVTIRRKGAYIPKGGKEIVFEVIQDKRERYPYKFENAIIKKENLPCGDYGLVKNGEIIAVVERKTLDNFIHQIATYDILKISLEELRQFKYKAVVFESPYSDFINPKKNKYYKPTYIAEILADLFVSFPDIQFIFCDNRKFANEWIYRWFKRIYIEMGI
ncbi:MAG: ERCC4 domain-containing protein [Candidatus Omnitrophica bacterium]|nr:ERCC4 domain-containing protein [Candidatus Omnitrophota bacterium]